MAEEEFTGMYELLDALEAALKTADPVKRQALAKTCDAYHWAIGAQAPTLGKYEATFRENEIDETVLPSLTEKHLKQLGVTALGHRVKLLDAIAALRAGTVNAPISYR
jgi:hypothetical protein